MPDYDDPDHYDPDPAWSDSDDRPYEADEQDQPRATRYATRAEAIDRAIKPALGEYGDAYDVEAICATAFEYRVDTDANGNELANTAGFQQVVSTDEFWAIAAQHERTA